MSDWDIREFSLIAKPSKKKFNPKTENKTSICIELKHITKETGRLLGSTTSNLQQSIKNVFQKENVLFGKLRPNLRKYIYCNFNGVCSSEIWVLLPEENIYPKFLFYLIQQEKFIVASCIVSGSKMPRADWDYVSKIPFAVPPLLEQKAIADLLSTWDTAIEKTETLITAKQQQFDWLHLNLILNAKNTTLKHFSDFLNESRIIDNSNDAQKRLTVRLHLKGVEVRECRGTEIEGATQYFVRKTGQLIYGKQNIFRGSIGIVSEKLNGYSSSQDIPAFDIAESIYPDWLFWYMSRLHFYKKLENFSAGSGSKRLHSKELFKIKIPIPAFPEQKRIAKILNTAKQEINSLKSLTKQYRTQKRGLMQKLLTGKSRINPKIINQHKEA